MLKRLLTLTALASLMGLGACFVDESESTDPEPRPTDGFRAQYAPLGQLVPFPNDLFFAGSQDGTVNLNVTDPGDLGDPMAAMNRLDGFSTLATSYVATTDAVEDESLEPWAPGAPGNAVLVDISDPQNPQPLQAGTDYTVEVSPVEGDARMRVHFRLLRPLDSDGVDGEGSPVPSRYMALLTNGVESVTGDSLAPDTQFGLIRSAILNGEQLDDPQLDSVREALSGPMQIAEALGYDGENVSVLWTFQTQSISTALEAVAGQAEPQTTVAQQTGLDTSAVGGAGLADIWSGTTEVPYFLDADNPLSGFWTAEGGASITRFSPVPEATEVRTIPLLVTTPSAAAQTDTSCPAGAQPGDGWPVVIFQHGITGNRTNALGLADILGCWGYAVAAIDHPLHGITDTGSELYQGDNERHFNLDVDEDGEIDDSGAHYINLGSTLTSRDNLRQSVADLLHLSASVPATALVDQTGTPVASLDESRKFFVGHSLGGIVGTALMSLDVSIHTGVLGMPGGHITELLQDSDTFGPQIRAGLQQQNANLVEGSTLFDNFFRQAQTVIDAGDPANYGADAQNRNLFMIQVDGDGVVPNDSTELLADTATLPQVSSTTQGRGMVKYLVGNHGSLLQPGSEDPEDQQVWAAMQCHTVFYIMTGDEGHPANLDPEPIIDVDGSDSRSPPECQASGIVE